MSKIKEFKAKLRVGIARHGYWSNYVYIINNEYQNILGYQAWLKSHDEVKEELRIIENKK